ncbi:thiamine-phosphate kinase [Polynucleobacter sp. UK-Kesae-W10]|uniref:thiamine-phosphate kinase n=1 Tax=Polynucleobacter sp. UK-Kesae-W10 TaxID=1819738 RepID=UPI001C0CA01D|nr:thiamine-phosphate kinase [Polynucleobacter sp. UK-Kesae-W10]MBU3576842.1 thiamine-phosphate kinase [Polynucleobacter sp. UK-Kesae-W10]
MQSHSNPLGEFDLIERFFKTGSHPNPAISLGIGDDCALLNPNPGEEMAITTDMLVEGRHFFAGTDPEALGRKALAVNLSDLAAMGAKPLGFTLAIALPQTDTQWLESFSKGLFSLANQYSCPLIGGDTTAGPLTLSITAIGSVPSGKSIRRSGAKPEDDVWVSGSLGDARLTLAALRHELSLSENDLQDIGHRMHQPTPRIELGLQLRGIATAALDISDGLLGDLQHVLDQSQVDAEIALDLLPKSSVLQKQSVAIQDLFAASGGDDYELCFTAPKNQRGAILAISQSIHLALTCIGSITPKRHHLPQVRLMKNDDHYLSESETAALMKSFDHFAK